MFGKMWDCIRSRILKWTIEVTINKYAKRYGIHGIDLTVVEKYCLDGEDVDGGCGDCDNLYGPGIIMQIDEKEEERHEFYESVKRDPYFVKRNIPIVLLNNNPPWEMYA